MRAGRPGPPPLPPLDSLRPEHRAYVRRLVAKTRVRPAEREDVVQEALARAHESRESPMEARALLFSITRSTVYAWLAKRQRQRRAEASYAEAAEKLAPGVEEAASAAERARLVREALSELDPIFREVVERVELDGQTMPQVTRALRIPLNTGYTRLHLGRERFAEIIARIAARRRLKPGDI